MSLSREQFFFKVITLFVFILPFIHLPGYFYGFEYPKFIAFVVGIQAFSVVSIVFIFKKNDWKILWESPLTKLLCLYLLVLCIANSLSPNPTNAFLGVADRYQGFLTTMMGFLLYCMTRMGYHYQESDIISGASKISFFLLTALVLVQGISLFFFHSGIPAYNGRVIGSFGNPNALAGYLAVLLPLFINGKSWKKVHTFAMVSMVTVIVFTGSRTGVIVFGIISLFFLFSFVKNRIKQFVFFASCCIGVAFALVSLYQFRISLWDTREQLLIKSLIAIKDGPLLGYGQGNFRLAYPKDRAFPYDTTHNIFLDTAIAAGIPGAVLFLLAIIYALRSGSLSIRVATIALLVFGQFQPFTIAHIALLWYLIGLKSLPVERSKTTS